MALLTVDFFSETLEMGTTLRVLLPEGATGHIGTPDTPLPPMPSGLPVLYLLHGLSDDSTAWLRYTSIDRYVGERPMAVVMPQVARSFYADEAGGYPYWSYLCEELPAVVQRMFRVSDSREDTYVAGLSMGGYGALKWALRQPRRFAAAASLSGALDVVGLAKADERGPLFRQVYGDRGPGPDDDLLDLLGRADPAELPRLWVSCGTEDHLLGSNHLFVERAEQAGVELTTRFGPGEHEWGVWDSTIRDVLAWLPPAPSAAGPST